MSFVFGALLFGEVVRDRMRPWVEGSRGGLEYLCTEKRGERAWRERPPLLGEKEIVTRERTKEGSPGPLKRKKE